MPSRDSLAQMASRARLTIMAAIGAVTIVLVGSFGSWRYAPLIGWDVAAFSFASMVWLVVAPMDAKSTGEHTNREDPGRTASDLIVVVAAVASLVAIGFVLAQPDHQSQTAANLTAGLALLSVGLSWFAIHTLFMLRYARLYYIGEPGGIEFNQKEPPRYLDFAYVAFTIGMTFQISDTNIGTTTIRAATLRHALLSFLFGTVILASAINLVVGIATNG